MNEAPWLALILAAPFLIPWMWLAHFLYDPFPEWMRSAAALRYGIFYIEVTLKGRMQ